MRDGFAASLSLRCLVLGTILPWLVLSASGQMRSPVAKLPSPLARTATSLRAPVGAPSASQQPWVAATATDSPLLVLQPLTTIALPITPLIHLLSASDANRDGKVDLIVGGGGYDAMIGELLGNGDGTFNASAGFFNTQTQAVNQYLVADLNADGIADLVVAGACGSPSCAAGAYIGVVLGNSDGTFQSPTLYPLGPSVSGAVDIRDLNKDGIPDLVAAGTNTLGGGTVNVLLGNGDGTFRSPLSFDAAGAGLRTIVARDINGDGVPDVVAATAGGFSVLLGNGDGTLKPAVFYTSGLPYPTESLVFQDINKDGRRDALIFSPYGFSVSLGQANGKFGAPTAYSGADYLSVVTDVNRDGVPDIVAQGFNVFLGNSDGTFLPPLFEPLAGFPVAQFQVADINGDGNPDIAVAQGYTSTIQIMLGDGNGRFEPPISYPAEFRNFSLLLADLNGDGKLDVATVGYDASDKSSVAVLLNNRAANYQASTTTVTSSANPANVRQAITYTATVANPTASPVTGLITFLEAGVTIATVPLLNGQAVYNATYPGIGPHTIFAAYSGDSANNFSDGSILQLVRAPTSMVLTTSGSSSWVGQPVTFSAKITSTYGSVSDNDPVNFYDGQTMVASALTFGGTATYTTSSLAAKGHVIKAVFPGDSVFIPSSRTLTQVVQKYATTTALTTSPNPSIFGQTVMLRASVTSAGPKTPTGNVKFLDGTVAIGTLALSNGVATLSKSKLALGTHAITAAYAADAQSAASTSPRVQQLVH